MPQIKKQVIVVRNAGPIIIICSVLNSLLIMFGKFTNISITLTIVLQGVLVAIDIATLILMIVAAVRLGKLKKQVKTMQEKESQSNEQSLKENENETYDQ